MGNTTVEGVVESNASGQGIENATVTVTYPDGDTFVIENATDENGNFSVGAVPGTGDSYDVTVSAVGFEDAQKSVVVIDGAVAHAGTLSLSGSAEMHGTITDATFSAGIDGVEVNVSNSKYEFTTTTDGQGSWTVGDVPGEEDYEVRVDAAGWQPNATTVAIADGQTLTGANLTLVGSGELEAIVYDDLLATYSVDTGHLDGATVTVEHPTLGSVQRTATDGTVGPVSVPGGETYSVTASMLGYDPHTNASVQVNSTVEFSLDGNATITGTVTDEVAGNGIENATIEIEYPGGETAVVENSTTAVGSYTIEGIPGTGVSYGVIASADGYRDENASTGQLADETATVDLELLPVGEATINGTVTDVRTGSPIDNATVVAELGDGSMGVVYDTKTDGGGNYEFVEVIGGYEYNVSIEAAGYENASEIERVNESETAGIDVTMVGNATIAGTVEDGRFSVPLENVSVTATGSQGTYTTTTGADGSYTIDGVPGTGEEYAVSADPDGYVPDSTTVELGSSVDGADVNLTLVGDAAIVATLTDGATSQPIGVDVNVTIGHTTFGEVTLKAVSADGPANEYRVSVPGTGETYNVTIDAVGYESGTDHSVGPLGSGEQETIAEALLGSAELTGTVTDDTSGAAVDNATVTATGSAGTYVAKTATDGSYTVEYVAGTGEQYAVTATARAYEDAEKHVSVPEAGATLDFDLVAQARFFGIEDIDAPAEVEAGETFEVVATIANLGSTDWNDSVELLVDGDTVANESVDLDASNNTTVTFEYANDDVGTYDVQVRTSNESVNTTVDVVAAQASPPSPQSSPPRLPDPVSPDVPDDVPVKHEEVGVIERDDETGRSTVTFSVDSTVDWIIFDEEIEGRVRLAELDTEFNETGGTDETDQAPGLGVAAYRIEVPERGENSSATIRLRVSHERIDELGVDPADLLVNRFVDGDWQPLETEVVATDEAGVVLEARTPGFSNFSVSAMRAPEAVVNVDPAVVQPGEPFTLSGASSTNRYGKIVAYEWRVGDRTYEGETVSVVLDDAGDYRIELLVTNDDGASDTAVQTLTIEATVGEPPQETPADGTPADGVTDETASDGQPGFGPLSAGVALLVGALLARRR